MAEKEYVEREALECSLNERVESLRRMYGNYDAFTDGFDECIGRVEEFPAADVAPVRHGRWEVYLGGKELMCSACKATFWDESGSGGTNYCPCCGEKMDLEGGDGA